MSKAPNDHHALRELARRATGALEVTLYWSPDDNRTSVELVDHKTEETVRFTVAPEDALDAFYHPFVHFPTLSDDRTAGRVGAG
jgi:hypothetical protein